MAHVIGAHVSTAGGLDKAVERGSERGCESIQIFNQSPRMWRPTNYGEDDFAAFKEAMDASKVEAVIIHAVYLINCATTDKELRKKSRDTLTHALRIGDGIGAAGVVLHPGSTKGEALGPALKRAGKVIAAALKDTDHCKLLLEQTAGHKGLIGRDFDETAELIDLAGGGERLGLCLDSCHMFVQGYDITDEEHLGGGPRRSRREGRHRAPRRRPRQRRRRPARLPPRPPRQHRQRRDGPQRPGRLPLRAPLRGPPGDPGDPRPGKERHQQGRSHPAPSACAAKASNAAKSPEGR